MTTYRLSFFLGLSKGIFLDLAADLFHLVTARGKGRVLIATCPFRLLT
jgi:hypothetical protein